MPTNESFITFDNKFLKQLEVVAMKSLALVNIFVCSFEKRLLQTNEMDNFEKMITCWQHFLLLIIQKNLDGIFHLNVVRM